MTPEPIRMRGVNTESSDLGTHVAVCQQRYDEMNRRLDTLERTLSRLLWAVVSGFGSVIVIMLGYILTRLP